MPVRRLSLWQRVGRTLKHVLLPEKIPARSIVDHPVFNGVVGLIIFVNVLLMGIEVDLRCAPSKCTDWEDKLWKVQENFFVIVYLVEMLLRLYYKRLYFFKSTTNVIDFLLVILTIFDVWILGYLLGEGGSLKAVSVLRTLRYIRLIRVARVLNKYHSLFLIFNGMLDLSRFAIPIIVVGSVIMYMGAILARIVVVPGNRLDEIYKLQNRAPLNAEILMNKGNTALWSGEVYWGSIPRSMFTLFQVMTGDWWSEHIARPVVEEQPAKILFFLLMVFLLKIGLPSILVGTACEELIFMGKLSHKHNDDRRTKRMNDASNAISEAFMYLADNHGRLHASDLKRKLKSLSIRKNLAVLDVHVSDVEAVFAILDVDKTGAVDCSRFIKGVIDVKNVSAGRDVTTLTVDAEQLLDRMTKLERLANNQDTLMEQIAQDLEQVGLKCGIVKKHGHTMQPINAVDLPGATSK